MIGTGSVVNPGLGLLMAIEQVPADIPEGFAATATLRRAGFSRRTRLFMAAASPPPYSWEPPSSTSRYPKHPQS